MDPAKSATENPDLADERRQATFDPGELGQFFWEGQLDRKRQILKYVEAQGAELRPKMPTAFMSRMEQLEDVARLVGSRHKINNDTCTFALFFLRV